jgi:ATP dependent DNA ligase-like protein
MLARSDALPRGDYSYEVKWDGFRAIVSTEDGLEVRSRRGWNMSERLPELAALPAGLVLDGELVAFGDDGRPSFPLLFASPSAYPTFLTPSRLIKKPFPLRMTMHFIPLRREKQRKRPTVICLP